MRDFLILILLAGCATTPPDLNPIGEFYRHELPFEIDDVDYVGTATVERKDEFKIEFKTQRSTKKAIISSCHRSIPIENPDKRDTRKYYFKVRRDMEYDGRCTIKINLLDRDGDHGSAVIFVTDPGGLEAGVVSCNGENYKHQRGGFYCESQQTFTQAVEFSESVIVNHPERCSTPYTYEDRWYVDLTPGVCPYIFKGIESGKIFRWVTRGFTRYFIEEEDL